MTLENRGFLSEFVEQQRLEVRQRHRERFDLADQVSDLGQRLMPQIAAVPRSQQNLLACGYFVRGLQTLQGSVLMAERGMVAEARILLRSALETLFYLGAALKDKEFANLLDRDHVARVEKLIGAHRRLSKDGAPKKFVQEAEVSLEQIRTKLGEGQTLPIADVARRAKMMPTYEGYYRGLSTDAAHPSSLSLATNLGAQSRGLHRRRPLGARSPRSLEHSRNYCFSGHSSGGRDQFANRRCSAGKHV